MKAEHLTVQQALALGRELPWAFVRSLSAVTLGKTPEQVDLGDLLEARFFSETREVRLFRRNGTWQAALLTEEPEDRPIQETYEIADPRFGGELTLSRDLDSDEDGQMTIAATRLSGWKEAAHG